MGSSEGFWKSWIVMHPRAGFSLARPSVASFSSDVVRVEVPLGESSVMSRAVEVVFVLAFQRCAMVGQVKMRCVAVAGACVPQWVQGRGAVYFVAGSRFAHCGRVSRRKVIFSVVGLFHVVRIRLVMAFGERRMSSPLVGLSAHSWSCAWKSVLLRALRTSP